MTDDTASVSGVRQRGHGDQRHLPGELGIWFFVAGDLVVFSLFFILIARGQVDQAELFSRSRATLDLGLGLINTLLLLTSSWFVALGVERSRSGSGPRASICFSLAIICACGFVANKIVEWGEKISHGIDPSTNDFYMYYFVFTGIHMIHVLIGISVLIFVRCKASTRNIKEVTLRNIETGAIFWHLVDLLWVVLFALLYLV